MADVRVLHTASLTRADHRALRELLDGAFAHGFTDDDYEHALGGMHAVVEDEGQVIAHGSVVMRRLLHGERALRTGYVEAVAVRADRRRQGHGVAVMSALERIIRGAYDVGALSASTRAVDFYRARGWQQWAGTTSVLARDGVRRLPKEEGGVYLLPVIGALTDRLDPAGDLACDWRSGDVW